jgi:hypothetical protein
MWLATVVLGREPHPLSAVRPLTAHEWHILVRGHGVPEDLLIGSRVTPPINYSGLSLDPTKDLVPCKEWSHLVAITNDPFYSDLFLPQAYFALRARKLALAHQEPNSDVDALCRGIYESSSDTTVASLNNNLASVFTSIKRTGSDRYKPDAMDIAALRAYGVEVSHLESSGLALTYSVQKYITAFERDFTMARRSLRSNVTVSRALDRGGLKSKTAAGCIPISGEESDGLRPMVAALVAQIWQPTWEHVIQPWLRQMKRPTEAQAFLRTEDTQTLSQFADSKGFTRGDCENLQLLLMLHLSVFRSQVWRDSVEGEFQLTQKGGKTCYVFSLSRTFKTITASSKEGVPQLTSWQLSETESMLVHTCLHLCRPLLATGTKRTQRFFLDAKGGPATQRYIEAKVAQVGKEWLGVPRLGPHALRTMWLSWLVNSGLIAEEDFDNLAAYVQVSRCTMLETYVTPSLNGPAQRVGAVLRDGGQGNHDSMTMSAPKEERPQGKVMKRKRAVWNDEILAAVRSHGGDAKLAFDDLVAKRAKGMLGESEEFFKMENTYFKDADYRLWKRWIDASN